MGKKELALGLSSELSNRKPRPAHSAALLLVGIALLLAGLALFVAPVVTLEIGMGGFLTYALLGFLLFAVGGFLIMVGLIARARTHFLPRTAREDALRRSARGLVLQEAVHHDLGSYGPPSGDGGPDPRNGAMARADKAIREAKKVGADVSDAEFLFSKASSMTVKGEYEVAEELFKDAVASAEQAQIKRVGVLLNDARAMLAKASSQGMDVSAGVRILGDAEEALSRRDVPTTLNLLNRTILTANASSDLARSQGSPPSGISETISIIDAGDYLELRAWTGTDDWQSVRWRVEGLQFVVEVTTEEIVQGHREDVALRHTSSSRKRSTLSANMPVPVDVTRASVDLSGGWLTVRFPKS